MTSDSASSDPIVGKDGSLTRRHPGHGEPYHAHEGARSEAEAKFITPSALREKINRSPLRILDVGFGLGVNCRAALDAAAEAPYPLHIDTVECEEQALAFAKELYPEDTLAPSLLQRGSYQEGKHSVRLYLKDLREALPELQGPYDLIFHDPFSPTRNTAGWTLQLFAAFKERVHPEGLLLTYSQSKVVRAGLNQAGWSLCEQDARPPHRPGTQAALHEGALPAKALPLDLQTLPYEDPDLCLTEKEIRSQREAKLRARKQGNVQT